jgi:hypothetical protein
VAKKKVKTSSGKKKSSERLLHVKIILFALAILLVFIAVKSFFAQENYKILGVDTIEFAEDYPYPPGKIAPKEIMIDELHQYQADPKHRYRLTVEGNNLENKDKENPVATFVWATDCGRFYEGGTGPHTKYLSAANRSVVWGYEFPEENCSEASVAVRVNGYGKRGREDNVMIRQKVFYLDEPAVIVDAYYMEKDLQERRKEKEDHPIRTFFESAGIEFKKIFIYFFPGASDADPGPGGVRG